MDLHLKNKVAIVTGGSNGIGRSISLALAKEGAIVVVNYNKDKDAADSLVNQIINTGNKSIAIKADVSVSSEVQDMIKKAKEEFNNIDILINNAGIIKDKTLMKMKKEDWHDVIDTNLNGVYNCSKAIVIGMMRQKKGRIINISSVSGLFGLPGQVNYSASKGGVNSFTKALAKELAQLGITVNAITPGFIESKMTDSFSDKRKESALSTIPMGRYGTTEEVGNLVLFLASDLSNYITGQIISIDGGM